MDAHIGWAAVWRRELREHAVPVHAARLLAAERLELLQRRVLPQQVPQVQPHILQPARGPPGTVGSWDEILG